MIKIPLLKHNSIYRLGDVILKKGGWEKPRKEIIENSSYRQSLLYGYLKKLTNPYTGDFDEELFLKTCQEFQGRMDLTFDRETLYLHLRLGDVVQRQIWMAKYDQPQQFKKLQDWFIFNHQSLITEIKSKLNQQTHINKLSIVSALHFGDAPGSGDWMHTEGDEQTNYLLLEILLKKIKKIWPRLAIISNAQDKMSSVKLADYELLTLGFAEKVILEKGSSSGFSYLAKSIRKFQRYE